MINRRRAAASLSRRMFDNRCNFAQQNFDYCSFIGWKNRIAFWMRDLTKYFATANLFQLFPFIRYKCFVHINRIFYNVYTQLNSCTIMSYNTKKPFIMNTHEKQNYNKMFLVSIHNKEPFRIVTHNNITI